MASEKEAVLLRIYVKENDKWEGKPVHMAIVEKARERGLAGATVLRGLVGFGSSSETDTARLLELSTELPMVIEIVDWADKAESFVEEISEMMERGLVTTENVRVLWYRAPADG
jgi:uncharacterized protein